MAGLRLVNTDPRRLPLAISAPVDRLRSLNAVIKYGQYYDVAGVCSLTELGRIDSVQRLIQNKQLRLDIVSDAISSAGGVPNQVGVGRSYKGRFAVAAGGTAGTADAVKLINSMPWPSRLIDVQFIVSTAQSASTAILKTASDNSGSNLQAAALSTAATGVVPETSPTTYVIPAGTGIWLGRTDRGAVLEVIMEFLRTG